MSDEQMRMRSRTHFRCGHERSIENSTSFSGEYPRCRTCYRTKRLAAKARRRRRVREAKIAEADAAIEAVRGSNMPPQMVALCIKAILRTKADLRSRDSRCTTPVNGGSNE